MSSTLRRDRITSARAGCALHCTEHSMSYAYMPMFSMVQQREIRPKSRYVLETPLGSSGVATRDRASLFRPPEKILHAPPAPLPPRDFRRGLLSDDGSVRRARGLRAGV